MEEDMFNIKLVVTRRFLGRLYIVNIENIIPELFMLQRKGKGTLLKESYCCVRPANDMP